jgi:hypothetical protein
LGAGHEHSVFRAYGEKIDTAHKALRDANQLLNGVAPPIVVPALDEQAARGAYATAVTQASEQLGLALMSPITAKTVEDFVRLAARKDPPFKNQDAGFRDAVHLHSVIEHLSASPLNGPDDFAVLITGDKRLWDDDVAEVAAEAQVRLKIGPSYKDVIGELIDRLRTPTGDLLRKFAAEWSPALVRASQDQVLPIATRNLLGTSLGRGILIVHIEGADFALERGATAVGPPREGSTDYPVSFELRMRVAGAARYLGGDLRQPQVRPLHVTLLLSVEGYVVAPHGTPERIVLQTAYAFAVVWQQGDVENPPENIQLLPEGA